MNNGTRHIGVAGSFEHLDSLLAAIQALKDAGHKDFEVFSPVPRHEIDQAVGRRKSPVRYFTFLGGLVGLVAAFALTLLTTMVWNMVVGGKPIISIPPFLVPVFELTILLAGIATMVAVFYFSKIPSRSSTGFLPEFSDDRFGLYVQLPIDQCASIKSLLESRHAHPCWLIDEHRSRS